MAAARLGMRTHVYEPAAGRAGGAGGERADRAPPTTTRRRSRAFAARVDVVTYEFENVALAAVDALAPPVPVRPGRRALEVAQDRLAEKAFLSGIGLATAPWAAVDGPDELAAALGRIGAPAILKTRRFGYDGKGQVRLDAGACGRRGLGRGRRRAGGARGVRRRSSARSRSSPPAASTARSPPSTPARTSTAAASCTARGCRRGIAAVGWPQDAVLIAGADPERARLCRRHRRRAVRAPATGSSSTRSRRGCTTPGTGPRRPA